MKTKYNLKVESILKECLDTVSDEHVLSKIQNMRSKSVTNDAQNDLTLLKHSIECGLIAKELSEKAGLTNDDDLPLCDMVIFASVMHDLGKADDSFQRFLVEQKERPIRHNQYSGEYLYAKARELPISICRAVVFHHPEIYEGDIFSNPSSSKSLDLLFPVLLKAYKLIGGLTDFKFYDELNDKNFSEIYKYFDEQYSDNVNFSLLIISSILKTADIISSSSDYSRLENNFPTDIEIKCPSNYDQERFAEQTRIAKECADSDKLFSEINAPCGYGKTNVGLQYAINCGKQCYWVCPRNAIVEGVYKNICDELHNLGLSGKISVAKLLGREFICGNSNSDIIVTNPDNYLDPALRTASNDRCLSMTHATAIFDEYHEYCGLNALQAAFIETLRSRAKCKNTKSLLLSATPIRNFLMKIDSDSVYRPEIKQTENFLDRKIRIHFVDIVPKNLKGTSCLISAHTVKRCQKAYINGLCDSCHHAKFTNEDIENNIEKMYEEHQKDDMNTCWCGTSVISTGINASWDDVCMILPTPEQLLQVGGRCNRWGKLTEPSNWYIVKSEKEEPNEKQFLSSVLHNEEYVKKFWEFLENKFENGSVILLKELYDARNEFLEVEKDTFASLFRAYNRSSYSNFARLSYLRSYKKEKDGTHIMISNKHNLRSNGDKNSIFVTAKDKDSGKLVSAIQMQMDFSLQENDLRGMVNGMLKVLKKTPIENNPYVENIRVMKSLERKKDYELYDYFKSKANCSETPFILDGTWVYSKEIGLYKKDKKN